MFTPLRALWIMLRANFAMRRLVNAGQYDAAIEVVRAAIDRCERVTGPHSMYVGSMLHMLISIYSTTGNFAAVQPLEARLTAIHNRILADDPQDLDGLEKLSRGITRGLLRGNTGPLLALMRPSVQAQRQMSRLGRLHERLGLDQVLPQLGATDWLLNYQTALYTDPAQLVVQEPLYRQTLAVWQQGGDETRPHVAGTLYLLALICARTGRWSEALQDIQHAAAIDDELVRSFVGAGPEERRLAYLQTVRWGFDLAVSLVHQQFSHAPAVVQTVFDLVLRRKGIAAEALAAQRDAALSGAYPALAQQFAELRRLRAQLAERVLAGPAVPGQSATAVSVQALTARKEQLEAELARRVPELALAQRLAGVDRQVVAASLPAGWALVEFVRFTPYDFAAAGAAAGGSRWLPARYVAFVLRAGAPDAVQLLDLGPADEIDDLVARFRATIVGDETVRSLRGLGALRVAAYGVEDQSGSGLRSIVFDTLTAALAGCTRLLIATDGELARLPFEVLPTADGGRVLDRYAISYVNSGRDLVRFGRTAANPGPPLVVADPDFELAAQQPADALAAAPTGPHWAGAEAVVRGAVNRFDRLPETRSEGQQVAALVGVMPVLGSNAVERSIKTAPSPRVLHLATHGFFLADDQVAAARQGQADPATPPQPARLQVIGSTNPLLRSGLAFAGANTWLRGAACHPEAEDGILTAEDVSGLNLTATELVVLSACETGLGQIRSGEGVFGLQRAFLLAGAGTLVMSLWSVPDRQTRELMVDFHTRLRAGEPPAAALRAAQQALKVREPDPYFWGGFVCLGDPGGVTGATPGAIAARGGVYGTAAPGLADTGHQLQRALPTPEDRAAGGPETVLPPGVVRQLVGGVALVLACVVAVIVADASLPPVHAAVNIVNLLTGGSLGGGVDAAPLGTVIGGALTWSLRPAVRIAGCVTAVFLGLCFVAIITLGVVTSTINAVQHGHYRCDPICHVTNQPK